MNTKIPFYNSKEAELFFALVKNDGKDQSLIPDFYDSVIHLWFVSSLLIQFRTLVNSAASLKVLQS